MTFSCMGKKLSAALIRNQYSVVLAKVMSGELPVRRKSILAIVMKARHVFRGGTTSDDKGNNLIYPLKKTYTHRVRVQYNR